jgi:hypothetical protein
MSHPASDEPNDDIDHIIRDALVVETDPHSIARLERFWHEESRKQMRRRRTLQIVPAMLAAAAMILVAAFVMIRRGNEQASAIVVEHKPEPIEQGELQPPTAVVAKSSGLQDRMRSTGRKPTQYERFVFLAKTDATTLRTAKQAKKPKIDRVIAKAQEFPSADPAHLLEGWEIERSVAENMLMRKLPQARGDEQEAVLRLLGSCGTARAIPTLLRAASRGADRDQVLASLERIVGTEGLPRVAIRTPDPQLQREIIGRLILAGSDAALRGYLSLVRNGATRDAALGAATAAGDKLSVDRLMTLLDDDDTATAMAAAQVLGHVNGPAITTLLIDRVTEQPSDSAEAWAALMACRGELARQFLDYAANRPQLLGHLNNARMQAAQMIP